MQIAIIDLGTNTFKLVVAELSENKVPKILHSSIYPSKMGKDSMNNRIISKEAIERSTLAIDKIMEVIEEFEVEKIKAFGTSALRDADNSKELIEKINNKHKINIEIISGDEEASLIYEGTKNAVNFENEKKLIVDIGGGSIELIIASDKGIIWKNSYQLGISRLIEKFTPEDLISKDTIKKIETYLDSELADLYEECDNHPLHSLIGSAGSFETIINIISAKDDKNTVNKEITTEIKLKDYFKLHQELVSSNKAELKLIKGMDMARVDLIVLASIFINNLIKKLGINKITQSNYSLKEGALFSEVTKIHN